MSGANFLGTFIGGTDLDSTVGDLRHKLLMDFNVKILDLCFSVNKPPEIILLFDNMHSDVIRRNIESYSLEVIIPGTQLYTKMNDLVLPDSGEIEVQIIDRQPYMMKINGPIPNVYFFVRHILTSKE